MQTIETFALIGFIVSISISQIYTESTQLLLKKNVFPKHENTKQFNGGRKNEIDTKGKLQIPFIVHQLWNNKDVPRPVLPYIDTWMEKHLHWQYWFWTKESQEKFLRDKYPRYLPLYRGYTLDIQRADMIRFLILYHFGGVYADLDVEVMYNVYHYF